MKRILLALALLALGITPALAQGTPKTKAALSTEITTNFPDNVTGAITPAILRTTTLDMLASWQQYASVSAQTAASYTVALSDYGQLVTVTNASPIAVTLPQATGSFQTFSFFFKNVGATTATITPITSTINGAASLAVTGGNALYVVSDGTNWQAVAFGGTPTGAAGGELAGTYPNPTILRSIAPTWTAGHTFTGGASINSLTLTGITGSTQCLHVNSSGVVSGTASDCGTSGGGITSITSTGGTLTVTTPGATNIEINLAHSNTWTAVQNFTLNNNANTLNVLTNTNVGNAAFTAWSVNNVVANGYFGITSAAYASIPMLTGRVFILTDGGTAIVFNTFTAAPIVFGVGNVEIGRFTSTGLTVNSLSVPGVVTSGTGTLPTAAIASGTCATTVSSSATGVVATDAVIASFGSDPTGLTGYAPSANGMLTIVVWPTANNVNWKVCNNTAASITPGAVTVNWKVVR